jgi:hypothetical protein
MGALHSNAKTAALDQEATPGESLFAFSQQRLNLQLHCLPAMEPGNVIVWNWNFSRVSPFLLKQKKDNLSLNER